MSGKNKIKGIFITGTDTAAGKTVVTGLLARYLLGSGFNVITQKWIQTGCRGFSDSDLATHIRLMGSKANVLKRYQKHTLSCSFRFPASPHLSAQLENRKSTPCKIKKDFRFLCRKFDLVLVEGVGGALVPYDKKNLVIDIAKELDLPVLVVAQNKLGTINHTLLTIEALKKRKIKILGIVFNSIKREDRRILQDNPRIIKAISKEKVLGILPWNRNFGHLFKKFIPIGEKIEKELIYSK